MLRVQFEPYDFNPRSREGSDIVQALAYAFHMDISIHAPARGASCLLQPVFQSTLPRGERRFCLKSALRPYDFNPRSREGSDSAAFRGSQSF